MLAILAIIPAFISATLTAFFCGIFIKLGSLGGGGWAGFISILITIVIGDLVSNIFWYMAGHIGGNIFLATFGRIFGIRQENLNSSMNVFNKFKDYVAFFVSAPLGMAIMILSLMNAGIQRHHFWKYIFANTLMSAIWIWIILALGYGFGYAYTAFSSIIGRIITSIGLIIVLFLLMTLGAWIRTILMSFIYKPSPQATKQ